LCIWGQPSSGTFVIFVITFWQLSQTIDPSRITTRTLRPTTKGPYKMSSLRPTGEALPPPGVRRNTAGAFAASERRGSLPDRGTVAERLETIGAGEFDRDRLRRPGVVVVAFLADWCPFCQALRPELPKVATGSAFSVLIADVSSEQSPLWQDLGIEVVPTLVVFKEGAPVFRADGIPGRGLRSSDLQAAVRSATMAARPAPSRNRA